MQFVFPREVALPHIHIRGDERAPISPQQRSLFADFDCLSPPVGEKRQPIRPRFAVVLAPAAEKGVDCENSAVARPCERAEIAYLTDSVVACCLFASSRSAQDPSFLSQRMSPS